VSRTFRIISREIKPMTGRLAIVCAGTADLPVAEEARRTAAYFGFEAQKFYDVGVAGLHRLVSCLDDLRQADCAIVVAGMEGALPSVVGGLIACPIVACPTSVGYGANLKGFTALLAMLNSCSEGISVVNIDNGFGAACAAIRILRRIAKTDPESW
jgi:NCAIR mutase (PurE)-related protein